MRIGIDARLYQETGVGRYITNLISKLSYIDQKNEYVIFTKDYASNLFHIPDKWKVIKTGIHWHSFAEQIKFPVILSKYGLDLVHFPYFSVPILYPGKFIITIHDLTILNYATGKASTLPLPVYKLKRLAYKIILRVSLVRAEKIIVPSYVASNELLKIFPDTKKKIVVTYEAGFTKLNNKPKKLKYEPFFLYVGNVYPHKNLERGVLAIKEINAKRTEKIKLVIVGKEDFFLNRLKNFVKKEKQEKEIIFAGQVSDEELSNLYNRAQCLFFPSLSEGFGLPALEAMQHGCLICCSDIPIFKEICQNIPFYFDPLDINDMVKVLGRVLLLDRQEKKLLKTLGLKRAKDFSWDKLARQTLNIYKEVK